MEVSTEASPALQSLSLTNEKRELGALTNEKRVIGALTNQRPVLPEPGEAEGARELNPVILLPQIFYLCLLQAV